MMTGALAGLVGITASAHITSTTDAVVIGAIADGVIGSSSFSSAIRSKPAAWVGSWPSEGSNWTSRSASVTRRSLQRSSTRSRSLAIQRRSRRPGQQPVPREMSHELRTPLNAIVGSARLVRRKVERDLDDRQAGNLDKILTAAEQLTTLINSILDLSRVEAGRMDVYPPVLDPAVLVVEVAASMEPLAAYNGIAIRTDVSDAPTDVYLDEPKVRRRDAQHLLGVGRAGHRRRRRRHGRTVRRRRGPRRVQRTGRPARSSTARCAGGAPCTRRSQRSTRRGRAFALGSTPTPPLSATWGPHSSTRSPPSVTR